MPYAGRKAGPSASTLSIYDSKEKEKIETTNSQAGVE
jgi:hypothetical protein